MNRLDDEQFSKFLRNVIAPMDEQEPPQDLWPRVHLKLSDSGIRVRWFDFVLVAIVVILCLFVPEAITGLLFNL